MCIERGFPDQYEQYLKPLAGLPDPGGGIVEIEFLLFRRLERLNLIQHDLLEVVFDLPGQVEVTNDGIATRDAEDDTLAAESVALEIALDLLADFLHVSRPIRRDAFEMGEDAFGKVAPEARDDQILVSHLDTHTGFQIHHEFLLPSAQGPMRPVQHRHKQKARTKPP